MQNFLKANFILLLFSFSVVHLQAQTNACTCSSDLEFLFEKAKKSPPYKINKEAFEASFAKAKREVVEVKTTYDCFVLLNTMMIDLNDNHAWVYGLNTGATDEILEDDLKLSAFKKSALFNTYPRPKTDLDSLKKVLIKQPQHVVEGVYSRFNYMTLGVYKLPNQNAYAALVLDSKNPMWEVGEIVYTLIPIGGNNFLAVGGSLKSKRMVVHTERIVNGVFLIMLFQKNPDQPIFSSSIHKDSTYLREELSPETTYLKVGSFNSWYPTLADARKFYKTLDGTLTKKNVILDLRDNGGGGDNNSDNLYDILKEYVKDNYVYVLINNRTASNAEQFTYKMSAFDNCKTFGISTYGSVAYEIKDGNYKLPCEEFIAVLTSKKHKEYLHLESKGVQPDVPLKLDTSWLVQLEEYLEK